MTKSPSTKSLRAFEAAARLGSIKAAAEYLHLSPSAISRRIQSLEQDLGQLLFLRDVQGLTLTAAGESYAERLREILKALDNATSAVRDSTRRRLNILGPAVVVQPCMNELHSIEDALPNVDLTFQTAVVRSSGEPGLAQADIAFFWGKGEWDGWKTFPITNRTHLVPLCSPDLLKGRGPFTSEELTQQTWIAINTFEETWKIWYEALGEPLAMPKRVMHVADANAAALVAQKGGGIYIGAGFNQLPNMAVIGGQLVPAHAFHAFAPDHGLHLGLRDNDDNPDVQKFIRWFFDTVWNLKALQQRIAIAKP